MPTGILLLRGINVGGRNRITMDALKQLLGNFGLKQIETYIQSGNVVFHYPDEVPPDLEDRIADAIKKQYDFRPTVIIGTVDLLKNAIRNNPFTAAEEEPRRLHLYFLASSPSDPDLQSLSEKAKPNERYHLEGRIFYLHAPEGIGRSKLASAVERTLGVSATARNWRSVLKIHELADTSGDGSN